MTRQIKINISEITETFDVYSLAASEKAKIIKAQADALKKADAKITRLRADNEKLRAALKRDYGGVWDELAQQQREIEKLRAKLHAATGELCDRAAAAALKETGDE